MKSSESRNQGELKRAQKRREEISDLYPMEWNELPLTRKDAETMTPRSTLYFNANPCKYNHVERRYTATGMCCGCLRIRQKHIDKEIKEDRSKKIIDMKEFRICPECNKPFLMLRMLFPSLSKTTPQL